METGGGGRSQGEGVMDNAKCHVREVGWGGQESDGSKPEPSGSVFGVAWNPQQWIQKSALTLSGCVTSVRNLPPLCFCFLLDLRQGNESASNTMLSF